MVSWKERTEISKNVLDVIKALFILGVIVVLLFRSDLVNDLFDKYNVLKLEFGGLTMDRSDVILRLKFDADQLPQLQGQITEAKQQLDDLQGRYADATKALTALKKERDDAVAQLGRAGQDAPPSNVNVQKILAEEANTVALVNDAKAMLQTAASTTTAAVKNLPKTDTEGKSRFAIIFGSYRSLPPAEGNIIEAGKKNYDGVIIYIRQGVFRTALQFPSEEAANAKLSEVRTPSQTFLSSQAYVVNLASWCPKPVDESPGVLNCRL